MKPKEYTELNELLDEYSRLSAELEATESKVNLATLDATRPLLPEHAETKARLGDIEAKLRKIAVENPELFPDDKKTHATPFGAISFRTSSSLEIEDEEKVMLRIRLACHAEYSLAAKEKRAPRFLVDGLIRTHEAPNLEALEDFSDEDLRRLFGIKRTREEKFTVKPLEVKADKLAKKAAKSDGALVKN